MAILRATRGLEPGRVCSLEQDITILGRDPSYRDVIRFGLMESDAVVCVSRWLEEQTREVFAYDRPIHVLPNFLDCRRFRPRVPANFPRRQSGRSRSGHLWCWPPWPASPTTRSAPSAGASEPAST